MNRNAALSPTLRMVYCLVACGWLGGTPPAAAAEPAKSEMRELKSRKTELARITQRLQAEQEALRKAKGEERNLLGELESLDKRLSEGAQRREELAGQKDAAQKRVKELQYRIDNSQQELKERKAALAGHLRMIHAMGGQAPLRVALSGGSIGQVRQGMRYFGYLVAARQEGFARYHETLDKLRRAAAERREGIQRLEELTASLDVEQKAAAAKRSERAAWLDKWRKEQSLRQQQVEELQQARREMTGFIEKLEQELAAAVALETTFGRIEERKGHLPPPAKGPRKEHPPGLFLPQTEGAEVHAVFRGRVVYADWFRGYGLLLILDHGDHHFSLYGHNRKLRASQGDWVEEGERIAEAGDTGSMEEPGIYFEMRQGSEAINPRPWLTAGG